ncbi:MAG: glycosyltransferase family 4 protein [Lacisediminihabitans sp.]
MTSAAHRTVLMAHPGAELYGSDRVLLESVSALVADGWRVVVAVPVSGPLLAALVARGAEVVLCPTPVLRKSALRPRGMLRLFAAIVAGWGAGWRLLSLERPVALYVNTMTIPLWQLLGRVRRVPVLSHVHEGEASASQLVRSLLALPLFLSTEIIANSEFSRGVLSTSFSRLGRRTRVVYNGVAGPPESRIARARLHPPVKVTYIGRLSPRKGVDVAIDAIALLSARGVDATLDLLGGVFPGYEWYEAQLREQVKCTQLDGRVMFHGFIPSIWEVVDAGDLVIVPSRADEPFGDTAVEAILSGRPVIASATSGLLEATAGYKTARTVTPGDAAALANGLQAAIDHWGLSRAATVTDIETARRRHGPEVYRKTIASIVRSLAK